MIRVAAALHSVANTKINAGQEPQALDQVAVDVKNRRLGTRRRWCLRCVRVCEFARRWHGEQQQQPSPLPGAGAAAQPNPNAVLAAYAAATATGPV